MLIDQIGAGLKLLGDFGTVDTSYNLTPEQLCEKVKEADALIIRSATQVDHLLPCFPSRGLVVRISSLLVS